MNNSASATMTLSHHDRIQAIKHHPEFQYYLAVWRDIIRKEQANLPLTDEEEAAKRSPRSRLNGEAEVEASRYGMLSRAERECATMTEEDLAWRDCRPVLDWRNTVAEIRIPLSWTMTAIEKCVGRIVRVYRERIGLTDARYSGPPLDHSGCAPQLLLDTLTVRIPLQHPVEVIDDRVCQLVRTHKTALGLASTQRIRGPKIDPWLVYRLHHQEHLSLLSITHQLCGTSGSPAYDEELNRLYSQVKRAYQFATDAIDFIGQEYDNLDSSPPQK